MITHTTGGVIRPRVAVARFVETDFRLAEAVAVRRCALYRQAFRGSAVSYPADALRSDPVARWITEHGVNVDAVSSADLDRVRLAGIDASHVVMHCHGEVPIAVGRAAFGRFVVDSSEQVSVLAGNPLERTRRLVVDSTRADELAAEVVTHERLDLVGLHSRIGTTDENQLTDTVVAMIANMAWISRTQSVVMSCVSLADLDVMGCDGGLHGLRHVAKVIDQAVEDGCIRFRYPRPAVTVSPRPSAVLPT